MDDLKVENVIGAFALAIADGVQGVAQLEAPSNVSAAGITLIGHVPGITIFELSEGLSLSHPGTVRLVDRMVSAGLAERRPCESDGRAVALYLTDAGTSLERKILKMRRSLLQHAVSVLTKTERQTMARITEKMLTELLRNENHALSICRLCDADVCEDCPIDSALESRFDEVVE